MSDVVLAGDVGGTKTLLALCGPDGRPVVSERFASAESRDLESLVQRFLASHAEHQPDRACFAVAGPVVGDTCKITNLPWVIDARRLERELGLRRARVINDFVGVAEAIPHLRDDDVLELNPGEPALGGHIAVLGAGTGLGEAILVRLREGGYLVVPSEGGHADFAPRDEREAGLWQRLRREHVGHVSYERVLSGQGLHACFEFLCEYRQRPTPAAIRERLTHEDPAAVVTQLGLEGADPIAAEALDLFASVYGAEAGNLALKVFSTGGIFLAGGIGPRIRTVLAGGAFLKAFTDKGRFRAFCERVPVKLITNTECGLLGAAVCALAL